MNKLITKKIRGIDVFYIKSSKFKTITWSMVFTHQPGNKHINEYYFISNALTDNIKKYPTNVLKYRYQSSLYGLDAYGSASAIGNNIVNNFIISYPNEKYLLNQDDLSKKAFIYLNEIVTNPILRKGKFTKKVFNENIDEANELHDLLVSIKDMYSYYLYTKVFYQDKSNIQFNFPEQDKLSQITLDSFSNKYNEMFSRDSVAIFVTGDIEETKMDKIIVENLNRKIVNNFVIKEGRTFPYSKNYQPKIIKKFDSDVSQSRIYLGYLTNIDFYSEAHPSLAVMNNIFGGFDQSKLFVKIREKDHLAYYVDSNYIADENQVVVSVSTSLENENLVIDKIKAILAEIKEGNFSNKLFEEAKKNCIYSLETIADSQPRFLLQQIQSFHLLAKPYDLDKRIDLYKSVSKDDVIEAANSLVLDTVYIYTLKGDNHAKN